MLNWKKIDNEKIFQQLVNDLFALEMGELGYKPSSSYIGADGAWDGRFEGDYFGLSGMFSVQSKWTTHDFNDAYNSLRAEIKGGSSVKGELTKAQENNVDHLFVATNAELRVGTDDHVGKLEALNTNEVKTLVVYYREKLRPLIQKYPLLLYKYFGVPQRPLFALYSEYLLESEPDLFTDHGLFERLRETEKVKNFVNDSRKKILLLYAPQGEGKSHFLIEIAKNIQGETHGAWQSRFCRPYLRTVEDAFQDEIDSSKSYLIFLDNADLYKDITKTLITALQHIPANKIKLILSCRTPSKDTILSWFAMQRIKEFSILELSKLSEQALIELLLNVSKNKKFKHPERIVHSLGNNPFYVISYARLITGESTPYELKTEIKNSLESGAKTLSSLNFTPDESNALLCELSIIVPFRLQAGIITQRLSETVNKTEKQTIKAIEKLVEIGLLRYIGASVRFSSDLNGNVYLSTVLDEADGEKIADELFTKWLPLIPEEISLNLAAAAHNSQTSCASEASGKLIRNVVATANDTDVQAKETILSWIKNLVSLAPDPVTDLLSTYLKQQISSSEISRDSYGPVILNLLHIPGFQRQSLDLIRDMEARNIEGRYLNYKTGTLVSSAVSPIEMQNIDTAISSLLTLDKWAESQNYDDKTADLMLSGVKEALGGSHEYHESYGGTMTFGRKSLVYSPKVDEYRNVAMGVYKKIFYSIQASIQVKAISIFSNIGKEANQIEGPFWERILRDKQEVLHWIAYLLSAGNLSYAVLAEIENTLIYLWSNNDLYPNLSTQAEDLLCNINRSPEFLVYKLFTGRNIIISDFDTFRKSAPDNDRWSWLVHKHMHLDRIEQDYLFDLIEPLSKKYITPDSILGYLIQLDTIVGNTGRGYVPLVESWAKHNTTVILKIIKDTNLISKVPERFKDGFYSVAAKNINTYIEDFAKSLIAQSEIQPIDLNRLINLIIQNNIHPNIFMEWMTGLIPKLNNQGIRVVLNQSYYMFHGLHKKDQELIVDLIELILNSSLTEEELDAYDFLIHRLIKEEMVGSRNLSTIEKKIFLVLKDASRLDYHENRLLGLFIGDDLEKFLGFVEYRLKQNQERNSCYLDAIPYDGFDFIPKLVKTLDDFNIIINRISLWSKAKLIYSLDIDSLIGVVKDKTDNVHGNYLVHYIDQKLSNKEPEKLRDAFTALYALNFDKDSITTYLNVLENAEAMGLLEEAKSVFIQNVLSGSYSSSLGEAPPELVRKKDALTTMKGQCKPGLINSLIDSLVQGINNDIQASVKSDEEIINPKV